MPSIVTDLLAELTSLGVRVQCNGTSLRFQPSAAVGDDLRARLKANKPEILAFLTREKLQTPSDGTDKTAKSAREAVPSVLSGQGEGVRAKKRNAAPIADTGEFDALEEWAQHAPVPIPTAFGVSRVIFLPQVDGGRQRGCVGHATLVLNDLVRLCGFEVRRTSAGMFRVVFPTVSGPRKTATPIVVPLDEFARRAIEDAVLAAMKGKGYLLAEIEREVALPLESDPAEVDA